MAKVISDLDDAISYINSLYNLGVTPPAEGDDDYVLWTSLINMSVNLWETEEGVLWNELFVKLADAATGDKVTSGGTNSYDCPDDFVFPASAYIWLGYGTTKSAYKVIDVKRLTLRENDTGKWCYFINGALEFNPNLAVPDNYTISYDYYKTATALSGGSDTFEMSDPLFAVYYVVGELKKEEGDTSALQIASQKMEAMKTRNIMPPWLADDDNLTDSIEEGLG